MTDQDVHVEACILHATYHPLDGDCWAALAVFSVQHEYVPAAERPDYYQAAVERSILDRHVRTHHTAAAVPAAA